MNSVIYLLLIIFSVFTANLTLQCALGIRGVAESKIYKQSVTLIKLCIILVSVILLWVFFSMILSSLISGMVIFVLLFPVSYMVYEGFEYLFFKKILKRDTKEDCFIYFPGGITAVSVFICINLAKNILETVILAFGFTLGIFLVCIIIREIRRRAALEAVPVFLRGKPLVLISLGFLSLIFSAASLLLLRMIIIR